MFLFNLVASGMSAFLVVFGRGIQATTKEQIFWLTGWDVFVDIAGWALLGRRYRIANKLSNAATQIQ